MKQVDRFDFFELDVPVSPSEDLPKATWQTPAGPGKPVLGFRTTEAGDVGRYRFLATELGAYHVRVGEVEARFEAVASDRPGILRPAGWHFEWSATGEAFFWNSTTTYFMAGLREDLLAPTLDRLAEKRVNRIRLSLSPSRQASGARWSEDQIHNDDAFDFRYSPWVTERPESFDDPGFDPTRFDHAHWEKIERILRMAQERGIVCQLVLFTDAQEPQNYPFDRERLGDDPNEIRYFQEVVARFAAFTHLEWCVTNEWALYRPDEWVEIQGARLKEWDPYGHVTSVHGHGHFPFRASPWCDFAQYQVWDEHGGARWAARMRAAQLEAGGPKPIVNEEFGYEDHYAQEWAERRKPPSRSRETRLRIAWELAMAGAHATTGESAKNGLGGWINGRGDAGMTLLDGHRHLRDFFESFAWWRAEPTEGVASGWALCRSEPGVAYAVYLPGGGQTSIALPDKGPWEVDAFDPETGHWSRLAEGEFVRDPGAGPGFVTPFERYGRAMAYRIRRPA